MVNDEPTRIRLYTRTQRGGAEQRHSEAHRFKRHHSEGLIPARHQHQRYSRVDVFQRTAAKPARYMASRWIAADEIANHRFFRAIAVPTGKYKLPIRAAIDQAGDHSSVSINSFGAGETPDECGELPLVVMRATTSGARMP
jgi:hypothetical protein